MNIRLIVAMHKPYPRPSDSLYFPLQVGKALSSVDLGIPGDDTGDNISARNPYYCELTAVYWAWKNLDSDAVGLCHYRRYFALTRHGQKWDRILTSEQAEKLMQTHDLILPRPRNYYIETIYNQYIHAHPAEPLDLALELVSAQGSAYASAAASMKKRTHAHIYNMFLMRRELFDAYCTWLFPVLFTVESRIDISGYSRNDQRVFGFLAERLLDVYVEANNLAYAEIPVCFMENQNWLKKAAAFLSRKFSAGKD